MTPSSIDAAITSRMPGRAFALRPVASATLTALLRTAAQLVPGSAPPPWKVHVLRGECRTSLCAKVCAAHDAARADPAWQAEYKEAYDYYPEKWVSPYLEHRRENGWGLYGLPGIGRAD